LTQGNTASADVADVETGHDLELVAAGAQVCEEAVEEDRIASGVEP
jgi:hypothetical protein